VSDHCLTRSVRDSALFLSQTEDPSGSLPLLGHVREASTKRLRIGAFTRTLSASEPDPEVRAAFEHAVQLCTELGHGVRPVTAPAIDGAALGDAFFLSAGAAMAGMTTMIAQMRHRPVEAFELEPFTWSLIRAFEQRGPAALEGARATFKRAAAEYRAMFSEVDVLLTPTLASPP
jgi:amidase